VKIIETAYNKRPRVNAVKEKRTLIHLVEIRRKKNNNKCDRRVFCVRFVQSGSFL